MSTSQRGPRQPADRLPVARVCVDIPLPHLDRPFDYLVPAQLAASARPGTRVRVRFSGQLVDGWLLERVAASTHPGRLAFLERVVSAEPVLDPEGIELARAVADRYAGSLADVLRLAVPPRHARAEREMLAALAAGPPAPADGLTVPAAGPPAPADGPPIPAGESAVPAAGPPIPAGESAVPAAGPPIPADRPPVPAAGPPAPAGGTPAPAAPPPPPTPAGAGPAAAGPVGPGDGGWARYPAGAAFLRALREGRSPRAVWSALPGEDWPARCAEAAAATLLSGRGVLLVVPDARDLARLDAALTAQLAGAQPGAQPAAPASPDGPPAPASDGQPAAPPPGGQPAQATPARSTRAGVTRSTPATLTGRHASLSALLGPAERYRRFLAARRGLVAVVTGTRAAMFAPVVRLGLVVIWDDGDDLHSEPRAPYPHAREVLLTRAQLTGAAALVAGYARTAEAQQLVETGWARPIAAERATLRRYAPAVSPTGDDPALARDPAAATARLPSLAWSAARDALRSGAPVLVQVPRRGYLPAVSCADCHTPARCPHCAGPLELRSASGVTACRWCARPVAGYSCPRCGARRLRAAVTGARRTAEELGRAFPGVPVRTSGREEVLASVPAGPALVVATPGAEPVAAGGYGAVLLLDAWALLTRADLRAAEETVRRWLNAAALARPASGGGRVIVVADGSLAPVQALVRWDPGWLAARELGERRELRFPPTVRVASLTGTPDAVADLLAEARLPADVELLGPVPAGPGLERMLVRAGRSAGRALAAALHTAASVRSARKAADPVRIQLDPLELL